MIDNLNNMLMPFNVDSKLSGIKEQAASFAALEQSSIKSGRLADVMAGNSSQIQFNQIFNDQLKSLGSERTVKPSNLAGSGEISDAELKQIVRALHEQLINAKPADTEMVTDKAQQPSEQPSQQPSQQPSEQLSEQPSEQLSEQPSQQPSEQLSEQLSELSQEELNQLLAANIEQGTPQQLDDLARLTGIDNEKLATLAEQLSTQSDPNKEQDDDLATQTQQMADLVTKLEQLIDALPNSEQLVVELDNLKQALAQQQAQSSGGDIEQIIERRVNQPIGELINQLQIIAAGADESEQQISALIAKLPIKDQQQLVAAMKAEQQQKNNELDLESSSKQLSENQPSVTRPITSSSSAAAISLADIPSAAIVSSLVNEKTDKDAVIKSIAGEYGEVGQETSDADNKEITVNPKTGDSFDNLLKQIAARTSDSGQNSPLQQSELTSTIASELGKAESSTIATKDFATVTKSPTEQLLAKLPLDQETQAARALKDRMSLMVKGDVQHAVIQLDPEELGGMSIRVQIQNDQMSVQFQVQNSQAKEMLENAMVKLKEMLDQQGIVLRDSDVQHQDKSDRQHPTANETGDNQDDFDSDQDAVVLTLHKQSANGIDYYA